MKKPLELIKKVVFSVLKVVPGVGPIAQNMLDANSTPPGVMDNKELASQLVSLGVLIVLAYLALSGRITWEDAEAVKDFVR